MAVQLQAFRQGCAGKLGKGREEVAEVRQVVIHPDSGSHARTVGHQRHPASAVKVSAFPAADAAPVDGREVHPETRGAVVPGEQHQRPLSQM
jgi:hypothetical protein